MTAASGDGIRKYHASLKTLEASGASISNGAIGTADDANYAAADTDDYANARFVLTCAFGGTPNANSTILLIIVPQNVDGTTDQRDADATYSYPVYGTFVVPASSSSGTVTCDVYNMPPEGKAMLLNGTGQTISSGWTLKMHPFTFRAAA